MHSNVHLLSTKELDTDILQMALNHGIDVISHPMITVSLKEGSELSTLIKAYGDKPILTLFTSRHAVRAIMPLVASGNKWQIGCLSGKTADAVKSVFNPDQIIFLASSAGELARKIVSQGAEREIVFFCGDRRLPELPVALARYHFTEVVVYKTVLSPVKVDGHFEGVLFFSPSAVDSFFMLNKADHATAFVSGTTTRDALKKYTVHDIVLSGLPGQEAMMSAVIKYYHHE